MLKKRLDSNSPTLYHCTASVISALFAASDSCTLLHTHYLISAVLLINMVMCACGACSHRADPQWHTFPEMSCGTNKMAPEVSQLNGNTLVSVSAVRWSFFSMAERHGPSWRRWHESLQCRREEIKTDYLAEGKKWKAQLWKLQYPPPRLNATQM